MVYPAQTSLIPAQVALARFLESQGLLAAFAIIFALLAVFLAAFAVSSAWCLFER